MASKLFVVSTRNTPVLRNRDGVVVDAVPFVVTCGSTFLLLYSFIPLYLQALGLGMRHAIGATTVIYGAVLVCAYHRQIYSADPERRAEVPADLRFRWLFYLMLVVVGLIVLLSLPLVFG